ncbi:MAG: ADP-ribosylglycohydrolase family protein [Firmicutes bacterium]|nr:ADP-ribosylglycohydrolase family protein [Bacillota bacterium]
MTKIYLDETIYRDKVYGCWLGKNIGGTLGTPLERRFGQDEMFDVWWYPDLPEGGIPNDDLELQLIWLQALKEVGPGLTARDLAEYWLDCIAYNFDEYGLSKTNLVRGLQPPVSGWHNNWFLHCMGSPIRSEIWACVAPGAPHIAAHYAFQDAICDHAGGESVYGEVFNAVVESCAFVIDDKFKLLDVGLSAIPADSETYRAIREVLALYEKGVDWREAREQIRKKFYHPVAQYSPINLAFQTIGWLYGEGFGDAICKAVNCGWDTDCTGATLGAILGIILGRKNIPEKWVEPLGDEITTNVQKGGIKNLKAPTNLHELTDEVLTMARRVLSYWNAGVEIGKGCSSSGEPQYTFATGWLTDYKPNSVSFDLTTLKAQLIYEDTAAVVGDAPTRFTLILKNLRPETIRARVNIDLPKGWQLGTPMPVAVDIPSGSQTVMPLAVTSPPDSIQLTNQGTITVDVAGRPALLGIPLVFLGGFRYLVSPVYEGKDLDSDCGVDENAVFQQVPAGWREIWRRTNDLEAEELFQGKTGVVYVVHYIKSEKSQPVLIGVPNNNRMKLFLNGEFLHETEKIVPLAPNEGGDGSNYGKGTLKAGWNQILVKLEKTDQPLEAHFLASGVDEQHPINNGDALMGVTRAQLPW